MKTFFAALLSFLFLACSEAYTSTSEASAAIATTPAQDQAAVQQLVQDVFDNIWSGTDTVQVRRYQTEDFVILEHGERRTIDTIRMWQLGQLANQSADTPKGHNSFEFFRNEIIGDHV